MSKLGRRLTFTMFEWYVDRKLCKLMQLQADQIESKERKLKQRCSLFVAGNLLISPDLGRASSFQTSEAYSSYSKHLTI